ncbi:MAG: hypothetical protein A2039_06175 [Candidatus Melainabacteria bacterium GWA2_34_9]|nr:MAG: hypothetical protein A2039_06175 [Candidatus Melainabacteria bacterium GWA2_34_9]
MPKFIKNYQEVNIKMPELIINKSITAQQQGYQNNPSNNAVKNSGNISKDKENQPNNNSVLEKIQSSNTNRELYSAFLIHKKNQYIDNIKDEKNKKIVLSIAGGVTLLLGGAGVILGRKNLVQLRGKINQSIEFMQGLKDSRQFEVLSNAKLFVTQVLSNALGYLFTFDKVKDFSLLKGFESMGKPGKMIVNASKGSLWITEKTTLTGLYKAFEMNVNSIAKYVRKALKSTKSFSNEQEKQLAQRLNVLLNGNKESKGLTRFADDLMAGIKERTGKLKSTIQEENIDQYREKYFPKDFKWSEFKRTAKNWKESLFSANENKDVLRENWSKTEEILLSNIDKTGANNGKIRNFGHAREQIDLLANEMDELSSKTVCSDEFKNLTKQVKSLNQTMNNSKSATNPLVFETSGEKYAGRVLDLSAGGGMSEMLIPPVAGGLVAYHTLKDSMPEDRKEKFIKSGGPELIGGLAGWMVTSNLLAISGATGMLAGLVTAGIMNIASRSYLRHLEKNRQKSTQVN